MENTIDLKQFCSSPDDSSRYDFTVPRPRNGHTYATDAKICVRVPTDQPDFPRGDSKFPDCTILDWKHADIPADCWRPWPDRSLVEGKWNCTECNGTGQVCTCKQCGRGDECDECSGTGEAVYPAFQPVGELWIDQKYDAKIRQLPNVRCFVEGSDTAACVLFVFDGGEGIVMPIAPDFKARSEREKSTV